MSKKKNKHTIKSYHWKNGVLNVIEHIVEDFEDAVKAAIDIACHMFKVFDHKGVVVREGMGGNYHSNHHHHHCDDNHHNPY